jgi:hypothetical protein
MASGIIGIQRLYSFLLAYVTRGTNKSMVYNSIVISEMPGTSHV